MWEMWQEVESWNQKAECVLVHWQLVTRTLGLWRTAEALWVVIWGLQILKIGGFANTEFSVNKDWWYGYILCAYLEFQKETPSSERIVCDHASGTETRVLGLLGQCSSNTLGCLLGKWRGNLWPGSFVHRKCLFLNNVWYLHLKLWSFVIWNGSWKAWEIIYYVICNGFFFLSKI